MNQRLESCARRRGRSVDDFRTARRRSLKDWTRIAEWGTTKHTKKKEESFEVAAGTFQAWWVAMAWGKILACFVRSFVCFVSFVVVLPPIRMTGETRPDATSA